MGIKVGKPQITRHFYALADQLWADYNARLEAAGVSRDAPMVEKSGGACASH